MERPKIEFEAKVGAKSPPKHSHPTGQWEGFQGVAMVWPHTLINAQDFKSTQNISEKYVFRTHLKNRRSLRSPTVHVTNG